MGLSFHCANLCRTNVDQMCTALLANLCRTNVDQMCIALLANVCRTDAVPAQESKNFEAHEDNYERI